MDQHAPRLDRAFEQRLRELFNDRDIACPTCRYNLRGVPGPRCPECGRVISEILREADLTPWRTPAYKFNALKHRAKILGLVIVLIAGVSALAAAAILWMS